MAEVDDAIVAFRQRYPVKPPKKRAFYESWGVPDRDVDGSAIRKGSTGSTRGKVFADVDDRNLKMNFNEIAKIYGGKEAALDMTLAQPAILAFEKKYFLPSFKAFAEIFGEEEAKGMVQRNPGLLAVKPTGYGGADATDRLTMQLSYVVAATRNTGPYLLSTLALLLSVPLLELISGVPIRATLFAAISGH
eukprot:CAMPEP_0195517692 /NCGR_PEP_ID=MMETSP0794_2-20130614/11322_1 /TAXON_ID=515487 /ORGANISM="Stephanopyxis turris, Strain CCMP 815" /LENGTH=190 /DNA_ID=CAMNT_0040646549 /DNA_START=141 /DNA_END=713 /DNA_ORIENTATION=+